MDYNYNAIPKDFEFKIDPAIWLRGTKAGQMEGQSLLLRSDGKMCCVGIMLKALGVPDASLLHRAVADEIDHPAAVEFAKRHQPADCNPSLIHLYSENDHNARRDVLTNGFAAIGIKVRFKEEVDATSVEQAGS